MNDLRPRFYATSSFYGTTGDQDLGDVYRPPVCRCEYCGRNQILPEDGNCRGCGAPLAVETRPIGPPNLITNQVLK